MDGCRSQAPRWHFREKKNPGSAWKEDTVRPWQASESQEPYRAPNPEDIRALLFASSALHPTLGVPKSAGSTPNRKPGPSFCLHGRQPGHPLAIQRTSLLLTFPLPLSPPSNHLHPAASGIQTQIKPWSSLTSSAPMTSRQASNNVQRPRTPQARTPGPLLQNPDFLLFPRRLPAPSHLHAFAPGIPCPDVPCWLLSDTSVSNHMPHPWRLTGPPLK